VRLCTHDNVPRTACRLGTDQGQVTQASATIRLCGGLYLDFGGRDLVDDLPGRQGRHLFAYLAANRSRPVGRDELTCVLWPLSAPRAPEAVLSTLLTRLRRALGHERLRGRAQISLVLPDDAWVDVEVAAASVSEAASLLEAHDYREALDAAGLALEILERPFLPELAGDWIDDRRRELDDQRTRALAQTARAGLELGGGELVPAERAARALTECEPYLESGFLLLMEVYARLGNVAKALRVYDELRVRLREELGVPPAPAVTALHQQLLHGDIPGRDRREPRTTASPGDASKHEAHPPLPSPISGLACAPLVGRERTLDSLRSHWQEAETAQAGLVLIAGDPGIGKTALAASFADAVHSGGATVLYGRADEESAVPHQPFVEAVRHYIAHCPAARLEQEIGPQLEELPAAFGGIERAGREPNVDPWVDPELRRYNFFEAVVAVLSHAAAERPVLLILEDLHWADQGTLLLLRHVLRRIAGGRMLVLVTYRDVEAADAHALARFVADARREWPFHRVSLSGLDEGQIAAVVSNAGQEASPAVSRRLREQTAGNPFFLHETLRTFAQSAEPGAVLSEQALARMGVPEGLQEVMNRRLSTLTEAAARVLRVSAVLGQDFSVSGLQAVLQEPDDRLVDALEELLACRTVQEDPGEGERYSFCHALLREAVYCSLSRGRRLRLHAAVAEALEARAEELQIHPAELAHHFAEARDVQGVDKAIKWATRAAESALQACAYEEATRYYEHALAMVEKSKPRDEALRCELLLALGQGRWQASDPLAKDTFHQAVELARRQKDPELFARAALGVGGRVYAPGTADATYLTLLAEALRQLPNQDSSLRAHVMARRGEKLAFANQGEAAQAATQQALEMARRVGDEGTLAATLLGRHAALLHVDHSDERLRVARETLLLVEALGRRELAALVRHWLLYDLLEVGDIEPALRALGELEELSNELHQPLYRHSALSWAAVFEHIAGRLGTAQQLVHESLTLARRAETSEADANFTAQLIPIRRDQGRLAELLPAVEAFALEEDTTGPWRAARPLIRWQAGDEHGAREALAGWGDEEIRAFPRDMHWLSGLVRLAETVGRLGGGAQARLLYELLSPYADRTAQDGFAECLGSVHRVLGLLAATLGRPGRAADHFEAGIRRHAQMSAPLLCARTECDYGELLLSRRQRADRARGEELLEGVEEVARDLDVPALAARVPVTGPR
jgi:DNA-binding SARP family transcriptional activator